MKKIHDTLKTANNNSIAYIYDYSLDNKYNLIWFGGLHSDMHGTKASAISDYAEQNGLNLCRFDYSGHGESSGEFKDCNISGWINDSLSIIDEICLGPQIFIGSSMGGWLALLTALKRKDKVSGIILLAPAVDMTEILMWDSFKEDEKKLICNQGYLEKPSEGHDSSYLITSQLIKDGRKHLLLNNPIILDCPIKIIHGMKDQSVPWDLSLRVSESLSSTSVIKTFIKDADHSLSRKDDLNYLFLSIKEMIKVAY